MIDLSQFQIADDFEALKASFATIVTTAERLSHFQRFEALAVRVTTAGNFALSDQFKVTSFQLSDFGNGIDMSAGGPANYSVTGGGGADTVTGSAYNDLLTGGGGNDAIHAGGGHDTVIGGAGSDWIDGGAGDDVLRIEQGETLSAGDRFTGGAGTDVLFLGGATHGFDVVVTDLTGALIDADVERLEGDNLTGARLSIAQLAGFNRLHVQELHLADGGALDFSGKETRGYLYLADVANQLVLSSPGFYGVFGGAANDSIAGSAANDDIRGNGGNDSIGGGDGQDLLAGGVGDDLLIGGAGIDALYGGAGNDIMFVDDGGDRAEEFAGEGRDIAYASVNYALYAGSHVEVLSAVALGSTDPLQLSGNELNNEIYGNAGANILRGGGGADLLLGGYGDDVYYTISGAETIFEYSGQGRDIVYASLNHALAAGSHVEVLSAISVSGTDPLQLSGNELDNEVYGNAGANVLRGGGGSDLLLGGFGNDDYYITSGAETIFEYADQGRDIIYTNLSHTLAAGSHVEILSSISLSSTDAINLGGNELDNQIYGNAGSNLLYGGGGFDFLVGGYGDDIYYILGGNELLFESAGQGRDIAYSNVSFVLNGLPRSRSCPPRRSAAPTRSLSPATSSPRRSTAMTAPTFSTARTAATCSSAMAAPTPSPSPPHWQRATSTISTISPRAPTGSPSTTRSSPASPPARSPPARSSPARRRGSRRPDRLRQRHGPALLRCRRQRRRRRGPVRLLRGGALVAASDFQVI